MNAGIRSLFSGLLGWLCCMPLVAAHGQVLSMTLAFEVNSPYGLSEPWFTLRHGLLRHPQIETVSERPDLKARTGAITTKAGKLLDLAELERTIRECGAGASLRGVEATVAGRFARSGGTLLLKIPGVEIALRPPLEPAEKTAFERLVNQHNDSIRVTGPLKQETFGGTRRFVLQVRLIQTISEKLPLQQNL